MKKLSNLRFGGKSAPKKITAARWEKLQADGKWFWIFKRGASWLTVIFFVYGIGAIYAPTIFDFQPFQFLILFGMFGGFIVSSLSEWSKMETDFQHLTEAD